MKLMTALHIKTHYGGFFTNNIKTVSKLNSPSVSRQTGEHWAPYCSACADSVGRACGQLFPEHSSSNEDQSGHLGNPYVWPETGSRHWNKSKRSVNFYLLYKNTSLIHEGTFCVQHDRSIQAFTCTKSILPLRHILGAPVAQVTEHCEHVICGTRVNIMCRL